MIITWAKYGAATVLNLPGPAGSAPPEDVDLMALSGRLVASAKVVRQFVATS